ncbi:MAG: hypothetical protein MR355_03140 [Lachnospiraceae bacterium]|nr:hypothetical protein [Lachnospiraceae bacterium]
MAEAKKTVLFIVEGASDKTALEKIFQAIYKRNRYIEFKFTDGDISSDPTVTERNVESRIYKIVSDFMKDKKLNRNDIFQVIQIFDMDGAYIPETSIVSGDQNKFVYTNTTISCKDTNRVKDRNRRKKGIMDYLRRVSSINNIPYEMYFMSCNLDHALYDVMNLDKDLKQAYADKFYETFIGHERMFIDFLKTDVVNGVPDNLSKSWEYITQELHSLERHTNLHIYFQEHPLPDGLL